MNHFYNFKDKIILVNAAHQIIQKHFHGLPSTHTTLVKSLISLADPQTGIVANISYRDLCLLLAVDHAPGRKGAGIPRKDTIRSYLRTLEENCPDDFKIVSQGQKLRVQFLKMPEVYAKFFGSKKESTDKTIEKHSKDAHNTIELKENLECVKSSETCIESPILDLHINNNIKTKQTNKTNQEGLLNRFSKKPIAADFYPSDETIEEALSLGLSKVTEREEIEAFIAYNLENNTLWADFNPIFLQWLKCGAWYQKQQAQKSAKKTSRSTTHAAHGIQRQPTFDELMQHVKALNCDAINPADSYTETLEEIDTFDFPQSHLMALESNDRHLRRTFY